MEAAQDELRFFSEIMRNVHIDRDSNPGLVVNIQEMADHFLFTGPNGTHMCFVFECLGGSLLDLIKHYDYQGSPSSIIRPLMRDVGAA